MVSAESPLCIRDFVTFFTSKFPIIHRVEGGSVFGKGCHFSHTTPQYHMIQPKKSCTLANLWRMWSPNMQLNIELELSSSSSWKPLPLKKVHIHHITNILRLSSQVRSGRSEGPLNPPLTWWRPQVVRRIAGLNIACPCLTVFLSASLVNRI